MRGNLSLLLLLVLLAPLAYAGDTTPVFTLTSTAVKDGGVLPVEFTGDGASATLPLAWSNIPAGTKSFTLIMHHVAPDMTKWYWVLYNMPPETTCVPKNVKGVGTLGTNSVNHKTEYAPPHSKGPGTKTYILTLYALDSLLKLDVPAEQVTRDTLLAAMKDHILGTATLSMTYTRTQEQIDVGKTVGEKPTDTKATGTKTTEKAPPPERPDTDRRTGFDNTPLAKCLDADGNGTLSTAEMEGAVKALKSLDTNTDGKISAAELDDVADGGADKPKRPVGGPLMRVLDADHDNALSAEEIANATKALKAADADKDGKLTLTEVDNVGNKDRDRNNDREQAPPPPRS
jgi:Raf kinase inhibitor-like YbhB/YbcL family protein